jgi:LysM repeat protein
MQNKSLTILLSIGLGLIVNTSSAQPSAAVIAYITKYKALAIAEMQRTGVPAAITLAQGIHESEAGNSELVIQSNNHFGIKCKSGWVGESVYHDDDAKGECFRKYGDPADSYKDHSDFLKTRSNYAGLFNLDPLNYKAWAYGLKKAGYATNPKYPQILIKIIETYNLQDFSLLAVGKLPIHDQAKNTNQTEEGVVYTSDNNKTDNEINLTETVAKTPVTKYPAGEFKINDTKVIFVKQSTSFLTIARKYDIPLAKLFEFNDMKQQEVAETDQLVYLQKKKKTSLNDFHIVAEGETLNNISQTEAIRMDCLLAYNNLNAEMQPAVGEKLSLRKKSSILPKLVSSGKDL